MATITYTYQWQASTDGGATWTNIAGATATSYTPPAGSAGKQVRVLVTGTNGDGTSQAASPASAVIVANPPVNTVAPSLTGTAQDGVALDRRQRHLDRTRDHHLHLPMAALRRRRPHLERHRRRNRNQLHATRRLRRQTGPRPRHRHQRRRLEPSHLTRKRGHRRQPTRQHRRTQPLRHRQRRRRNNRRQRHLDRHGDDHLHLPVAALRQTAASPGPTSPAQPQPATPHPPAPPANKPASSSPRTNGDGSSQATSPASAVILANPPVNTVAPSLSATAKDGVAITAAKGTWTGVATITYTYQWQASTDGGATWTDIAGATATSYTPPAGSAGKQVRVLVTGTNGDGTSQAPSPASAVIVANPPVNTVAPSISGTPKDGVAITAAKGTWTGMATITYTYQWQLSADGGLTWTDIPGATATTYTPPAGTAGKQARVLVTGTNPDGSSQAASPPSAVIVANPPVNTIAPSLSATAKDGVAITANNGTWTGLATITYTYQWQASTDGGATWNDIAGATATNYTPPAGSAGKQVPSARHRHQPRRHEPSPLTRKRSHRRQPTRQHRRTQPHRHRTRRTTHSASTSVPGPDSRPSPTPTSGSSPQTAALTWTDIPGATATNYTPPAGTAGKQARVLVTATNPDGSSQAASPASAVILANPPVNTVAPSLTGTAQDGQPLGLNIGTWTGIDDHHLHLPMAALRRRRPHLDRHPRRDRNHLHPTRRHRRQTSTRPRHRHQPRRLQPSRLNSKRRDSPRSARQHRRTQPDRHSTRRTTTRPQHRYLDRTRDHHLHLPMAALRRRRPHLDRHPRRNRNHPHPTRRHRRQTSTRPRHRHQPRRLQPSRLTPKRDHPCQASHLNHATARSLAACNTPGCAGRAVDAFGRKTHRQPAQTQTQEAQAQKVQAQTQTREAKAWETEAQVHASATPVAPRAAIAPRRLASAPHPASMTYR